MRKLLAVLGATLFMTACGGMEMEESAPEFGQTEQDLITATSSCPAGSSPVMGIWECEPVCNGWLGNVLYTYCSDGSVIPTGIKRCGACY